MGVSGGPGAGSENAWHRLDLARRIRSRDWLLNLPATRSGDGFDSRTLCWPHLDGALAPLRSLLFVFALLESTQPHSSSSFDCIVITTSSSLLHHRFAPSTSPGPPTVTAAHSLALSAHHSYLFSPITLGPPTCCVSSTATEKHCIPHTHTAREQPPKSSQTSHLRGRNGFLRRRHASK
jgi:hypothetical protein